MRSNLHTIRFRPDEAKAIEIFMKKNPIFESFSMLGRVAVMAFIQQKGEISWQPIQVKSKKPDRPQFLWDYDLSKLQIEEILTSKNPAKKEWLIAKILEEATFQEVFEYLTITDIVKYLPKLKLRPQTRERWGYAVKVWTEQ